MAHRTDSRSEAVDAGPYGGRVSAGSLVPSAFRYRLYVVSSEPYSLFFEIDADSPTIKHISVQPADNFYTFSFQICRAP